MDSKKQLKQTVGLDNKNILITGAAGFIGAALSVRLLKDCRDSTIVGVDNLNSYYDVGLKEYRLERIRDAARGSRNSWRFIKIDIDKKSELEGVCTEHKPGIVVNLAAQAGVRYSIANPDAYIKSNIIGFYNVLECCRNSDGLEHLVYASSSSVYGGNKKIPFSTEDNADHPVSLYAATKKSGELLAYSYSKLYGIPSTGLRFFTVYGPAGRPDMAYFSFAEKLTAGEKIDIFNYGNMKRDFTYVDDIVEGIVRVMQGSPAGTIGGDGVPAVPYSLYNIGGGQPENLMDFVCILADELKHAGLLSSDFKAEQNINLLPMQAGDVPVTFADSKGLEEDYGFKPVMPLREGLRHFVKWYKEYKMAVQGN